jgi:signal transduction histidine kinase
MKTVTVFLLLFLQLLITSCKTDSVIPKIYAEKGYINIETIDFNETAYVELNGEWEFYYQQIIYPNKTQKNNTLKPEYIYVPKSWNGSIIKSGEINGLNYASYRLKVKFKHKNMKLALYLPEQATAYDLYVDGRFIASQGRFGRNKQNSIPEYKSQIVNYQNKDYESEIVFHVSNFHHRKGGLWEKILIGSEKSILELWMRRNAVTFFLMGSIFIMALYHLGLFVMRKKDKTPLYFSFFCFLIFLRLLFENEQPIHIFSSDIPWPVFIRTIYITLYLALPFLVFFIKESFPFDTQKNINKFVVIVSVLFVISNLILPVRIGTYFILPYQIIAVAVSMYLFVVLIRAVVKKREGAIIMLSGFLVLFMTAINDILHANIIIQTRHFIHHGMFIFILAQSYLLSHKFAKSFRISEKLRLELDEYSFNLTKMVKRRTSELETALDDLKKSNATKDRFLEITAHDLRGPLSGFRDLTGIMDEEYDDLPDAAMAEMIKALKKTSSEIYKLLNNLLEWSRIQRGGVEYNPQNFKISEVIYSVINLHNNAIAARQLNIKVEIDEEYDEVFADYNMINTVVRNLLNNAIKYSHDAGNVNIEIKNHDNRFVQFSICDNGVGISDEKKKKIFQIDTKVATAGTKGEKGTGLGLILCKEYVELNEGKIWFDSLPGSGSVFYFTITKSK